MATAGSAQAFVNPAAKAVTTAGTRVQLTSTATLADNLVIQAIKTNTGNIFLGDSSVSSTRGFTLVPGQFISFEGSRRRDGSDYLDLSTFWLDCATNGDGVQWAYYKRS